MNNLKPKISTALIILAGFILLTLFLLIPAVHNNLTRTIIMQFGKNENVNIIDCKVHLATKNINISNLVLTVHGTEIKIPSLLIKYDLPQLITKLKSSFIIESEEVIINKDKLIITAYAEGVYNHRTEKLLLSPILKSKKIQTLNNFKLNQLSLSTNLEYSSEHLLLQNTKFKVNEGDIKLDLGLDLAKGKLDGINIIASLNALPLSLYKALVDEEHPVHKFFEENIEGGVISSAEIDVKIPPEYIKGSTNFSPEQISEKFLDEYINAEFKITDITYKYSDYMPFIHADNIDLFLKGKNAIIDLKNSSLGQTKIVEGKVTFNYLAENLIILANGSSNGKIQDLIGFIHPDSLKNMANSNIDLTHLNGFAESKINIEIPMAKGSLNKYDIKTQIKNLNGKLFKDRLDIKDYNISGYFDGNHVVLNGKGKLNDFSSNVNLKVNIDENADISHELISKINLEKTNIDTGPIKIMGGKSDLKIEMIARKNETTLAANADLSKLHFIIPSISLEKTLDKNARLKIEGKLKQGSDQNLTIKLLGDDGLKISGRILTQGHISKFKFDEVKYLNNNFKAEVTTGGKFLLASIKGGLLDLSQANFSDFADDQNSKLEAIKLQAHLDIVKLKNNVSLQQAMIDAECNKGYCPVARFSSAMGSGNIVRLEYDNNIDSPKWLFETNNAGILFAGLGLTNKLKNGQLSIEIAAPLSKTNDSNYVANGKFLLSNFDTTQNKFLTRMVSFISIPGLVSSLTKNNIHFDDVKGDIGIQNNIYSFSNVSAEGPFFNFHAKGKINQKTRKVDIKGQVVPSLYGLNRLVGSFPLLKALFGKKGGVIFTPFYINEEY